jgi:peptide/nickel transport system substrate-binding protein
LARNLTIGYNRTGVKSNRLKAKSLSLTADGSCFKEFFMKSLFRILPLAMLAAVVLGLALPVAAQGMTSVSAPDCSYGGEIKSIEAIDSMTVKFTFCYPDPAFPSKAAFSAFAIHSSDQLNATGGGGDELLSNPIGTGPYKLDKWDRGNEIDFSRNDNYWGTPAIEPTAILKWNSEATARWNELQAGTIDGISNVGPADFPAIEANPDMKLYPIPSANILYLGINNTVKPFDNPMVRQALAYGIDRQRIVDNFFPPGSTAADQFMPTSIFGYTPDSKTIPYDPEMAKQLLADSGVTLPIETTLSYRDVVRSYLPQPGVVAQDVQAQLAAIGVNVTINVMESGAFLDAAQKGQLSLHLLGWGADYPDATNFLDYHFGAGSSAQFGDHDPKLTDLLSKAAQLSDPAARLDLYKQANNEIADFVPMVPIAHGGSAAAFAARIKGAYGAVFSAEHFLVMEDPNDDNIIYMQNAEPISLYCNDESDGETLTACEQVNESLLGFELGSGNVVPALATEWSANADLTEWTFTLRPGVTFSDGSTFDADDVITSWDAMWDAASPLHKGRTGDFTYFSSLFGAFLNAPPASS